MARGMSISVIRSSTRILQIPVFPDISRKLPETARTTYYDYFWTCGYQPNHCTLLFFFLFLFFIVVDISGKLPDTAIFTYYDFFWTCGYKPSHQILLILIFSDNLGKLPGNSSALLNFFIFPDKSGKLADTAIFT